MFRLVDNQLPNCIRQQLTLFFKVKYNFGSGLHRRLCVERCVLSFSSHPGNEHIHQSEDYGVQTHI